MHSKEGPETTAGVAPQTTEATPESTSVTEPVTSSNDVLWMLPASGDVMVSVGAVLSRLTVKLASAVLSAKSAAVAVTSRFALSSETSTEAGH